MGSTVKVTVRHVAARPDFAVQMAEYRKLGWRVQRTPTGISLVTDGVCGVEMHGEPVADLLRLMHRRGITWPTLDVPGNRRLVVLAAAPTAVGDFRAVRSAHASVRHSGATIPLPPTVLTAGPVRWVIPPSTDVPSLDLLVSTIKAATDWRYTAAPRAAS